MNNKTHGDDGEPTQSPRPCTDSGGFDAARDHREDLEALADTDLPAARWAERLLALLDAEDRAGDTADGGGGRGRSGSGSGSGSRSGKP